MTLNDPHALITLVLIIGAIWVASRIMQYHNRVTACEAFDDDLKNRFLPELYHCVSDLDKKVIKLGNKTTMIDERVANADMKVTRVDEKDY